MVTLTEVDIETLRVVRLRSELSRRLNEKPLCHKSCVDAAVRYAVAQLVADGWTFVPPRPKGDE